MKKIVISLIGIAIIGMLFFVPKVSWAKRTLVLYTFGGTQDEAMRAGAAKAIEKQYDCDVLFVPGMTSTNITKLIAAKDHPEADLVLIDDIVMPRMISSGVIQPYTEKDVPNIKNVYPNARLFGDWAVAYMFNSVGILYNYEKVKDPPTSWLDLANPKFKGHVVIGHLAPSAGAYAFVALNRAAGGTDNDFNPGFNIVREMLPNLITFGNSDSHLEQLFTQSDTWIGAFWRSKAGVLSQRKKLPIKFVFPKEGAMGNSTYMCLVKGTKNRDLAVNYINQLLEPSNQEIFTRLSFNGPANRLTKLPPDIAENTTYGEEVVNNLQFVDPEVMSRARSPEMLERWQKEFRK